MARKRCWGPEHHVKDCRPARPLCRWRAKLKSRYQVCICGAYHFPHRSTSGACGSPEKACAKYLAPASHADADDSAEVVGETDESFDMSSFG